MAKNDDMDDLVVFITGAAKRIGAAMARRFHAAGADVAVHYRGSKNEADKLVAEMNSTRADSARGFRHDLTETDGLPALVDEVVTWKNRLDCLVNNASSFYPTPLGEIAKAVP